MCIVSFNISKPWFNWLISLKVKKKNNRALLVFNLLKQYTWNFLKNLETIFLKHFKILSLTFLWIKQFFKGITHTFKLTDTILVKTLILKSSFQEGFIKYTYQPLLHKCFKITRDLLRQY